ncbi:unnamed protein product [Parajaminaea phylloscopi]
MLPTLTRRLAARSAMVPLVISPKQLAAVLPEVKVLDATWFMPNLTPKRDANREYLAGPRIPGALRWDPDFIATTGVTVRGLPHMMPVPSFFAQECSRRNITPDSHVVVYDTQGVFSSPRVAFTFSSFGHRRVSVLNGGLPAWKEAGLPLDEASLSSVDKTLAEPQESHGYPLPELKTGAIRTYEEMLANVKSLAKHQQVLDARPKARFDGTAPEPRQGMSSGHMPRATSLPFSQLLETVTSKTGDTYTVLKEQPALYQLLSRGEPPLLDFESLRHDSSSGAPAITATCGSGMTAAIIWLALQTLGVETSIYDESWMGWAGREAEGAPIVKTSDEGEDTQAEPRQ